VADFDNRTGPRNGVTPYAKTIAAGIIVLFVGGLGKYIWDLNQQLQSMRQDLGKDYVLMAVHRADLDRLNDFMVEGKRFTLEKGEDLEDDIGKVAADHAMLQLLVSKNTLRIASMPHSLLYPFDDAWKRRISDLEKGQAINAERIDKLQKSVNK